MSVIDRVKKVVRRDAARDVHAGPEAALSLSSVSELALDRRDDYVRALLPIAFTGGEMSEAALARLYQLFAMTELWQLRRLEILEQIFLRGVPFPASHSTFQAPEIQLSLAKDAIAISGPASSTPTAALTKLLEQLNVTPGQISFLNDWIGWENRIMEKIGRKDLQVRDEDLPTELLSKAAAIGVPLTALYFSGSVVGLSAAGITSGLATIGNLSLLAGLGFNPMTAGIVALIVAGISIKKILEAILPNTREDPQKLENSFDAMKTINRRYRDYLKEDVRAVAKGRWWERLTGRASARRETISRLQTLADREILPLQSTS